MNLKKSQLIHIVPFLALLLRTAYIPTANFSYLLIAAYAMFGRAQAIQALALSWLFTMLNPGIGAEATAGSVGRYVVLLGALLSVFLRSKVFHNGIRVRPVTLATLMLGLFFVAHSLVFSPMADVSVLKAVSWTLTMSTSIAAWAGLGTAEREALVRQIFGGLVGLMIVSLPLIAFPLGYLRNGTGFQGVLNHPQVFGLTMALLGAWAAGRMFGQKQPPWSVVALMGACIVLIVLSEARTAGVAFVLAVGSTAILMPRLSGCSASMLMPGLRSKRVYLVGVLALFCVVLVGARLESTITSFISKSGRSQSTTLLAAYERSRGEKIEEMWVNIQDKPLHGIGFGLASNLTAMKIERDSLLGLPTRAAVEKGVLPMAVWEELGFFGFVAVASWVLMLLRQSARGGVVPVAVGMTALLLNMGEATLFSPGGFGLLSLILIGWAFASGQDKERKA